MLCQCYTDSTLGPFSSQCVSVSVFVEKTCLYLQSLDGAQRGEQSFADCLQFVVVQRQQVEVLQVLEGVDSQTVNFVGIQQPETQRQAVQHLLFIRSGFTCSALLSLCTAQTEYKHIRS